MIVLFLVQLLLSDTLFCYYNPCKNGGTCEEHGIGYKCRCTPGFEGQTCEGEDISSIYSFVKVFTFHRNHINRFVYCLFIGLATCMVRARIIKLFYLLVINQANNDFSIFFFRSQFSFHRRSHVKQSLAINTI